MRLYYFFNGKKSEGPFVASKLKQQNICKETPVWFYGLPEWVSAGQIGELADLPDRMKDPETKDIAIFRNFKLLVSAVFGSKFF